jgi:hypothetical protein
VAVGFSALNVLESEVLTAEGGMEASRTIGFGVTFQRKRLNLGAEAKKTEGKKGAVALGVNYVPIDNAIIGLGVSNGNDVISAGIGYRVISYNYNKANNRDAHHLVGIRLHF